MTLLKVVHILGAATWLGCNVAQAFLGGMVGNASADVRAWYSEAGEKMAKVVYNAAGIVILLTGIGMVSSKEHFGAEFSDPFVGIGFAAIIIGAALGITVFAPKNRALAAAVRSGSTGEETKLRSTIMAFGILDTAIVVFTIGAMVYRLGA